MIYGKGGPFGTKSKRRVYLNLSPEHVVEEFQQKW